MIKKVLVTNKLDEFVAAGGTLELVAAQDRRGVKWFVDGITGDGKRSGVYIGNSGERKEIRSPNAAFKFMSKQMPEAGKVVLPTL